MDCRKYKAWIIDAAVGGLHPARYAELHAHVGQCEDCRLAFEHAQDLQATIDRGIVQILGVDPSPQLAARVRRRIAANAVEAETRRFGPAPRWVVATAVGILAVVAGIGIWRAWLSPSGRPAFVSSVSRVQQGLHANFSPPVITTGAPESRAEEPMRNTGAKRPVKHAVVQAHRRSETRQPGILVEKSEAALVLALYTGLRTGRIEGQSLWKTPPGYKQKPDGSLVPTPLEIQPIKIAELGSAEHQSNNGPSEL
ncbi:MAG TPA: hypothetical protein VKW70_03305 [Terriglobia bacterium]|nr:hypothetical protein [Terriglobia bacterium]